MKKNVLNTSSFIDVEPLFTKVPEKKDAFSDFFMIKCVLISLTTGSLGYRQFDSCREVFHSITR